MSIMRFCNYAIMGMWNYVHVLRGQSHNPIISQFHNSTVPQSPRFCNQFIPSEEMSGFHPSDVDFRLVLWRNEVNASRGFTQGGGVGEVGNKKGVESDAKTPVKSRVRRLVTRLHPPTARRVKSGKPRSRLQKYRITTKGEQLASRIRERAVGGAYRIFISSVQREFANECVDWTVDKTVDWSVDWSSVRRSVKVLHGELPNKRNLHWEVMG